MHNAEENFYKAVAIVSVLLGVIIVYFIVSMIRHQLRNVALYNAKIKAEIDTLENERKRIASDIHDELGPILSAVRIQINHLDTPSDNDLETIEKVNKYIDDVLAKTREISYNLLPNTLVRKGLVAAIKEFISKTSSIHNLSCSFKFKGEILLTKEQEINIYRIVQEVVNNALKHAEAKELHIELYRVKDSIILNTHDDGKGFEIDEKMTSSTGLGLYNLQSRAGIMKARFNFSSDKINGTYYQFEIPIVALKSKI